MEQILSLSLRTGVDITKWLPSKQKVPTFELCLDDKAFRYIMAYHHTENYRKIEFTNIIKKTPKICYIQGNLLDIKDSNRIAPVIVKASDYDNRIEYEIQIYCKLRQLKCPIPWFSSSFYLWDRSVLVLESLTLLSDIDDPCQIGQDILQQLKYLHKFGVHNNIKPNNIGVHLQNNKRNYFLLNYEGTATETLKYGYRRRVWPAHNSSQLPQCGNQVTTAKNDFLELGYTLRTMIQTSQQSEIISQYIVYVENIRSKPDSLNIHDQLSVILAGQYTDNFSRIIVSCSPNPASHKSKSHACSLI